MSRSGMPEPFRDPELEALKTTITRLRYALQQAPPKQQITDDRYWAWLLIRDQALKGTLVIR